MCGGQGQAAHPVRYCLYRWRACRTEPVAAGKPPGIIPGEPDAPVFILPGQCLERQVDAGLLALHHERGPAPRMTEDQQLCRPQLKADIACALPVVDTREHQ